jgi:hypothetical protein
MGDNSAPTLANIYLSYGFDDILMNNINVTNYHRFIDDIFFIYKGSVEDLHAFKLLISQLIEGIDVTMSWSLKSVDFLDLKIFKNNGHIQIKTHQKSLNRYLYLPPFSFHPPASFKGWIKAELIRYARTNTKVQDFNAIKLKFFHRLLLRSYSRRFLTLIFHQINHDIRNHYHLNQIHQAQERNIFPFIIPFNTSATTHYLKQKIPGWSNGLQKFFPGTESKVIFAFKQPPNIMKLVSRSNITGTQEQFLRNHPNIPIGQKFIAPQQN